MNVAVEKMPHKKFRLGTPAGSVIRLASPLLISLLYTAQVWAQEGGEAAAGEGAAKAEGTNLIQMFIEGGPIMWPLLAILIAAIFFTVTRVQAYSKDGNEAKGLPEEVGDLVASGNVTQALSRAESQEGPVAASLAVILRNQGHALEDVERMVEVTSENYFLRLEKWLPELDTFTTLSPLLGLLGTILGMVKVFQQFTAAANDEAAKQRILAGVGESLYATAFGIAIAVFCFAIYNYFSARQRTLAIKTQQASTRLLAQMHERNLIH
ncbi:MAG: MotA/TolQ/ExbB proton channel family protein [Armatimonadaceae bacterium]